MPRGSLAVAQEVKRCSGWYTFRPRYAAGWCGWILVVSAVGCTSFRAPGPADFNVIQGRQLTQSGIDAGCRGDWREAENFFQQATAISQQDVPARQQYAKCLWRRGAKSEAVAAMVEAVRLSGSAPGLHVELGEMYLAQNDLRLAKWHADAAIRGNPRLAGAWALLGDVRRHQSDPTAALAAYHRALSHQPDFPRVQLEAADLYRRQGRPQRCLATLNRLTDASLSDETAAELFYRQGLALLDLDREDDAVDHFTAAIDRGLASADLYFHLGRAELLAGRPAAARWSAVQALGLTPDHRGSRELIAQIDKVQQRMAAAVDSRFLR